MLKEKQISEGEIIEILESDEFDKSVIEDYRSHGDFDYGEYQAAIDKVNVAVAKAIISKINSKK